MRVKVVDIWSRRGDGGAECLMRFVWPGRGPVLMVPVAGEVDPFGDRLATGIHTPGGIVHLEDGEPFIDHLHQEFRGNYLWATKPQLVDEGDLPSVLSGESSAIPGTRPKRT